MTVARAVHDLSLSAWFGGQLAGAVALNGAAASVSDPRQRNQVSAAGWARFSPVLLASIASHVISGVVLTSEDRYRLATQQGFRRGYVIKSGLTAAALGASALQTVHGQRAARYPNSPVSGATQPSPSTHPELAKSQRYLNVLQWMVPALTGSAWIVHSANGELHKGSQQVQGTVARAAQVTRVSSLPSGSAFAIPAAALAVIALRKRRSTSSRPQPVAPVRETSVRTTTVASPSVGTSSVDVTGERTPGTVVPATDGTRS